MVQWRWQSPWWFKLRKPGRFNGPKPTSIWHSNINAKTGNRADHPANAGWRRDSGDSGQSTTGSDNNGDWSDTSDCRTTRADDNGNWPADNCTETTSPAGLNGHCTRQHGESAANTVLYRHWAADRHNQAKPAADFRRLRQSARNHRRSASFAAQFYRYWRRAQPSTQCHTATDTATDSNGNSI